MSSYVYKYVSGGAIIYIGITDNLQNRLKQHGKNGDNIPEEGWEEISNADIYYAKVANRTMADVIESALIKRYSPKYNKAKKATEWDGLPIQEPNFLIYHDHLKAEVEKLKKENDHLHRHINKLRMDYDGAEKINAYEFERIKSDARRFLEAHNALMEIAQTKFEVALASGQIKIEDVCPNCPYRKKLKDIEVLILNDTIQGIDVKLDIVKRIKQEWEDKLKKQKEEVLNGEDNNIC